MPWFLRMCATCCGRWRRHLLDDDEPLARAPEGRLLASGQRRASAASEETDDEHPRATSRTGQFSAQVGQVDPRPHAGCDPHELRRPWPPTSGPRWRRFRTWCSSCRPFTLPSVSPREVEAESVSSTGSRCLVAQWRLLHSMKRARLRQQQRPAPAQRYAGSQRHPPQTDEEDDGGPSGRAPTTAARVPDGRLGRGGRSRDPTEKAKAGAGEDGKLTDWSSAGIAGARQPQPGGRGGSRRLCRRE